MKKIVFILMLVAISVQVCGQTYDTIYNRSDELYYSEWYDTACVFYDSYWPCCLFHIHQEAVIPLYAMKPSLAILTAHCR